MTDPFSANQDQSEAKCKRVEEALQKSEEKFLELLEHINDIFYELDKQGIILSQWWTWIDSSYFDHPAADGADLR